MLNNKTYDVLKWIAMLFLPALAALVRTVFPIWHIPYGEEISQTIVAVNAFLGMILGLSSFTYHANGKADDTKDNTPEE